MALIDLALLSDEKVYVDTSTNPTTANLIGLGALNAETTVYYGDGSVNLTNAVGVTAVNNSNIVATGGSDVTLDSGLLSINALTGQNLLIDGDSSITLNAAGVSVAGVLTDLLNSTTVEFSGGGAGTFQFTPPTVGLLSTFTITVDSMSAGDKIVIPIAGNGVSALREPSTTSIFGVTTYTGYDATNGYLTLTNGTILTSQVTVKIKMTQEEYDLYAASRSTYLNAATDTFTFPGTVDPDEPVYVVKCFARGTLIETVNGKVAVENLKLGDLVLTKDHGPQPIRWIGSKVVDALILDRNAKLRPIRIRKGALGKNIPEMDLIVSPQHRILIRSIIAQKMFGTGEVLVAAKQLLQVKGIDIATDMDRVEYFHILFDQHEVVMSNGAETESLYTGPEALKSFPIEALEEIFTLFPELRDRDYSPKAARSLASGRQARKLAIRHIDNNKPLVTA